MRVLFAAAEVAPLAKVGGLADVAGALPQALHRIGVDVRVIMPRYASIDPDQHELRKRLNTFEVPAEHRRTRSCTVWEGRLGDVPVYLLEEQSYLSRAAIYGGEDEMQRFTFFCRALLEASASLRFRPDVLHVNDWHTAILPGWLRLKSWSPALFENTASLLTIHNLAHQGRFSQRLRREWDLVPSEVAARKVAGVRLRSAMALGIYYADVINTVSPTYAQEILGPELGVGLDPLLRARRERLDGVLNGIDVAVFDPQTDTQIHPNYGPESLERKAEVKVALQREANLPARSDVALIGVVSRLTEQKGLDLVAPLLHKVLGGSARAGLQLVVLGTGEPALEDLFAGLAQTYPQAVAVSLRFDVALAQRIYAGADLFLMPSRFEPCGLGQLIALRYGTVPIVRATGGLRDTVRDWTTSSDKGNGFVFESPTPEGLLAALRRALRVFEQPANWRKLQQNGMRADVSWARSAARYRELYERARALRSGGKS